MRTLILVCISLLLTIPSAVNGYQTQIDEDPQTRQEVWDLGYGYKADINRSCRVDFLDLLMLFKDWLQCYDPCCEDGPYGGNPPSPADHQGVTAYWSYDNNLEPDYVLAGETIDLGAVYSDGVGGSHLIDPLGAQTCFGWAMIGVGEAASVYSVNNGIGEMHNILNPDEGTIEVWFAPSWNGTNQGGPGVGGAGAWNVLFWAQGLEVCIFNNNYPDDGGQVFVFWQSRSYADLNSSTLQPGENSTIYGTTADWVAGQWHHIAFCWDQNILRLYLDGGLVDQTTRPLDFGPTGTNSFYLNGANLYGGVDGWVDDTVIWNNTKYTDNWYIPPIAPLQPPASTSCYDVWRLGYGIDTDLNGDCHMDLLDAVIFANDWQRCNDPCVEGSEETWNQPINMTIVKAGQPNARIIVSPNASYIVQDAAEELQTYIEKISGAQLPIGNSATVKGNLILVGRQPEVDSLIPGLDGYDLAHDGFVIKSLPEKLVITGQSDSYLHNNAGKVDCGTLNAVYYFLESLGCRWYMPGEDGEVVPNKATITVSDFNLMDKPDFKSRWLGGYAVAQLGGSVYNEYLLWLTRNRANWNAYHQGHTLKQWVDPDVYFAQHPEWFPLINGQRYSGYAQVCTSNTEMTATCATNFNNFLQSYDLWRSYPVGQNDSFLWCECTPCLEQYGQETFVYDTHEYARTVGVAAGSQVYPNIANGYLKFINAVAQQTEQVHPDTLITYYALYNIPGFPEVLPRDNVMPVMCHMASNEEIWCREVSKWEAISQQLYYYTYMGYRLAFPKLRITDDIRWCYEHKGIGMYLEHDEYSPLNMVPFYLAAKSLWDTTAEPNEILAEFYSNYYGAAEVPMRQFYETFEAATRDAAKDYDCFYEYPPPMTSAVATTCRGYLTQALSVNTEPAVIRRIESISRYFQATELHILAQEAMAVWRNNKTEPNRQAAEASVTYTIAYINSVSNEFYLNCRIYLLNNYLNELSSG